MYVRTMAVETCLNRGIGESDERSVCLPREQDPGLFEQLADRGYVMRDRLNAIQVRKSRAGFGRSGYPWRENGRAVAFIETASRKDEGAGHELHLLASPHQENFDSVGQVIAQHHHGCCRDGVSGRLTHPFFARTPTRRTAGPCGVSFRTTSAIHGRG